MQKPSGGWVRVHSLVRGVSFGTAVPAQSGTTIPGIELYTCARNNSGVADNFSNFKVGLKVAGASLSAAHELSQAMNVQALAQAVDGSPF